MEITQFRWTPNAGWETPPTSSHGAELVFAFSDAEYFRSPECYRALRSIFQTAHIAGFYSYGELAPFANAEGCRLHNQTMTLTTLSELSL
jgi:hypothetical protein